MKRFSCVILALLPLTAMAATYPIEVEQSLNGTEVTYSTQQVTDNMGAITLNNLGQTDAQCSARFRNGPEAPRTRKVLLKAGEQSNLTVNFTRSIIKLRIKLECSAK